MTYEYKYNHNTGSVVNTTTNDGTLLDDQFLYYFYCTGREKEITDCSMSDTEVNAANLHVCDENMVATLLCDTGDAKLYTSTRPWLQ